MEQLPKIVSDRLRTNAIPGSHPDANLLTEYAERSWSLDVRERDKVAAHLAACSDCREILFLATPPASEINPVPVRPQKSSWLSVPVLKWGTAAALAVIVGAAALLLRTSHSPQFSVEDYAATKAQTPQEAQSDSKLIVPQDNHAASAKVPSSVQPGKGDFASEVVVAPKSRTAPSLESKQTVNMPLNGRSFDELKTSRDTVSSSLRGAPVPSAAAPARAATNESVTARSLPSAPPSSAGDRLDKDAAANRTMTLSLEPAPPRPENSVVSDADTASFIKAKPAQASKESAAAGAGATVVGGFALNKTAKASANYQYASVAAAWSVSPAGDVQRSFDSGGTWNRVFIAKDAVFRVVATAASHVWAGGKGGVLYHSSDAGTTWNAVTPTAGGATLTGDVAAIEFSDPQHGKISTSAGETWTTNDGGQTWQKR
jgi:hypothetical protein